MLSCRHYPKVCHVGPSDGVARLGITDHDIGKARFQGDFEQLVRARTSHIRVNQQHSLTREPQRYGQVCGNDTLAFSGASTGHDDGFRTRIRGRKQDVRANRPDRFGKFLGHRFTDQGLPGDLPAAEEWDHSKERKTQMRLDFLWLLDATIEILEKERQANTQKRPDEQPKQQVITLIGTCRETWRFGLIHDSDIARFELTRYPGLAASLQQSSKHRLIARGIT